MKKAYIIMWYISLVLFGVSLFPFIQFMFIPAVKYFILFVSSVAVPATLYAISNRKITHPKYGYTAMQAKKFYILCKSEGLETVTLCRKNHDKLMELGSRNEYSENVEYKDLLEMFTIGCNLVEEKKEEK